MSKGDGRIIVQSWNDFSKPAEQLLNNTEVIHISQEEISSGTSEIIDWSLIKLESLGLRTNNILIVTCTDEYAVQTFKHSGGEKVAEFSYKTDENVKSAIDGCILFTVILFILQCMCLLRFSVDIWCSFPLAFQMQKLESVL